MRIIIFLFCCLTANAQKNIKGEVIYKYLVTENLKNNEKLDEASQKMYKRFTNYLNNNQSSISFQLSFNKSASYYKMIDVLEKEGDITFEFASMMVGGDEEVYTSLESKDQIIVKEVLGDSYLIKDSLRNDWVLTSESKVINNYTCFKATRTIKNVKDNLEIMAWYCPELPYNFGPRGYAGLPGLILELTQKNITYKVESIRIKPESKYDIKKPTKGIKITHKEFEKMLTSYNKGKSGN